MLSRFLIFVLMLLSQAQLVVAQISLQPVDTHELHNVWQLSPRIMSGSEPEGDRAFAELAKLGVKTIVSVDGIAPRIDLAKKHGLRYIHVPIGYDGIDEQARGALTRVAQDVRGSIYIHCHHGKHRGPAAAAIICRVDDGRSAEAARAILEKAGTGREYPGLWRDVEQFVKPAGELPALSERAEVESLTGAMARIDRTFDRLKMLSQAKWQQPLPEHPDVVASHEALQLLELFTEAARAAKPTDLQHGLQQAAALAEQLKTAVNNQDAAASDKLLINFSNGCTSCHKQFRNFGVR